MSFLFVARLINSIYQHYFDFISGSAFQTDRPIDRPLMTQSMKQSSRGEKLSKIDFTSVAWPGLAWPGMAWHESSFHCSTFPFLSLPYLSIITTTQKRNERERKSSLQIIRRKSNIIRLVWNTRNCVASLPVSNFIHRLNWATWVNNGAAADDDDWPRPERRHTWASGLESIDKLLLQRQSIISCLVIWVQMTGYASVPVINR